jgi:hypothetical protein
MHIVQRVLDHAAIDAVDLAMAGVARAENNLIADLDVLARRRT